MLVVYWNHWYVTWHVDWIFIMKQLTIPFEVADGITLANLIEARNYLKSELDQWNENPRTEDNPNGYWLHVEDIAKNYDLIRAMNLVIGYFGGERE